MAIPPPQQQTPSNAPSPTTRPIIRPRLLFFLAGVRCNVSSSRRRGVADLRVGCAAMRSSTPPTTGGLSSTLMTVEHCAQRILRPRNSSLTRKVDPHDGQVTLTDICYREKNRQSLRVLSP